MTRKKKDRLDVVSTVKSIARDRVGQPKASRIVQTAERARVRGEKHKPSLSQIVRENESQ